MADVIHDRRRHFLIPQPRNVDAPRSVSVASSDSDRSVKVATYFERNAHEKERVNDGLKGEVTRLRRKLKVSYSLPNLQDLDADGPREPTLDVEATLKAKVLAPIMATGGTEASKPETIKPDPLAVHYSGSDR